MAYWHSDGSLVLKAGGGVHRTEVCPSLEKISLGEGKDEAKTV